MRPELVMAVGGAALLVFAFCWRLLSTRRARDRMAQALAAADPVARCAAVRVATEQGLRPYAALLLARVEQETDPDVRAALADGVVRNAWEPADQRSILRLRLWAHAEQARLTSARPALRIAGVSTRAARRAVPSPVGVHEPLRGTEKGSG